MKILIAADSFKDSLDSFGVCRAIGRGIQLAYPDAELVELPLSDGGEGLSDIAGHYFDLEQVVVEVCDPLFRPIKASYGYSVGTQTAFIEMAKASGLQLLSNEERNPLKTSTFGFGQLIQDAIQKGAKRIIMGLGGSATNDVGIGMATALGWVFRGKEGEILQPIGENLDKVATIEFPQHWSEEVAFEAICDVKNPLFGENGAAHIFAQQKGADQAMIEQLDAGLVQLARVSNQSEKAEAMGAGAAGGLGFGCLFFLNAQLKRGIDSVLDWANFDQEVATADWIFTGEGRLDRQTLQGKLISGIAERAKGKPIIALCGGLDLMPDDLNDLGIKAAFSITQKPCLLSEALVQTAENLEKTSFNIARLL
ncbi:MAG: glycerate kinase [Flectobacillus sp.]|nr:glycerate kinase [Flectobacillus sp.]